MKNSIERELRKIETTPAIKAPHYVDPVIADRSRRYRGELIISADRLLEEGDSVTALRIVNAINEFYPYQTLLPGDFTVADSTFYEGKAFSNLLRRMALLQEAESLDSLMDTRKSQWLRYYRSLSPSLRSTLSRRSLRLLR